MPSPNLKLKHERNLRGWSQGNLAEQIRVPDYYISRWESGKYAPSPHYQQKLCEVFGKTVEELGFLVSSSQPDKEAGPVQAESGEENTGNGSSPSSRVRPWPERSEKEAVCSCRRMLVIFFCLLLLLGGGVVIKLIVIRQQGWQRSCCDIE